MTFLKKALLALIGALIIGAIGLGSAYYHIKKVHQEHNQAVKELKKQDIQVTFPEGLRREEMALLLEKKGICSATDFLAASTDKEGYLFPDTYRFFPNTPASQVVEAMTTNFTTRVGSLHPSQSQLILASIVEREAQNDSERSAIAGVYSNRLAIGMKLDADPTVQYAKDTAAFTPSTTYTFWQPITQADYAEVISPYNTYRQAGLPPGPIANPGKQSIIAAINPDTSDYLYFLHKEGHLLLAKTFEEHLQNQ